MGEVIKCSNSEKEKVNLVESELDKIQDLCCSILEYLEKLDKRLEFIKEVKPKSEQESTKDLCKHVPILGRLDNINNKLNEIRERIKDFIEEIVI